MENLNAHSSVVGNLYRPSAFLSAILSERFQITVADLNEGLVCLKPIGRSMKKAVYDVIITNHETEEGVLQTRELRFKEWDEVDGDGVFQLSLARYEYRKVRQVRVSLSDIKTASLREAQSKGSNSYNPRSSSSSSKPASKGEKRQAMLADI